MFPTASLSGSRVADSGGCLRNAKGRGLEVGQMSPCAKKPARKSVLQTITADQFKGSVYELALRLPKLVGEYEIALKAKGTNVPRDEVVKSFERKVYPWEESHRGYSLSVYAPFTPDYGRR